MTREISPVPLEHWYSLNRAADVLTPELAKEEKKLIGWSHVKSTNALKYPLVASQQLSFSLFYILPKQTIDINADT